MERSSRRGLLFSMALLVVVACGDAADDTQTTTTAVPVAADSSTTTTTEATTSTTAPTTTTTTAAPTTTLPTFPPPASTLEHGGEIWAVVLAGSENLPDPLLDEAVHSAEDAGYVTGPTDCDLGAPEALGQRQGNFTVSVYFDDEETARAAFAAFRARDVGGAVALVQTFCLD